MLLLLEAGTLPRNESELPHDISLILLCRFLSNRKSWGAPFCLGLTTTPHYSPFTFQTLSGGMSGLVPHHVEEDPVRGTSYDLQCFPLYSVLLALGNPTVHYLSLDIEGAEFQVGCVWM